MNLLDLFIVATMLVLMVRGVFRGFFGEISSLVGILLGIWTANRFSPELARWLGELLPPWNLLSLVSFGLIFLLILVAANLLGVFLKKLSRRVFLGWLDRTLGLCVAMIKGILITYLGIIIISFLTPGKPELLTRSLLAPLIIHSYQGGMEFISPGFRLDWRHKTVDPRNSMRTHPPDEAHGLG